MFSRSLHPCALLSLAVACGRQDPRCVEGAAIWSGMDAVCVEGDLIVRGRTDAEVAVLGQLEEITGSLVVFDNPELVELPALDGLVRLGGSLSIADNPALTTVHGFPGLTEIDGGVFVADNPALATFTLGAKVASVRSLDITANQSLTAIHELSGLERVTNGVRLARNDALAGISLPALAQVRSLEIADDAALAALELPALRTIEEALTLRRLGRIEAVERFSALREIGATVSIAGNPALITIDWSAESTAALEIVDNPALQRVRGAESVHAIAGHLGVVDNERLVAIEGFEALMEVGSLIVRDNPELQALASMPGPTRLTGTLRISDNPLLVAPQGWLAGLQTVDSALWIVGNDSLAVEAVEALLAQLEVGGTVRTGDNGGEDTALDPCPFTNDNYCDAGWDTELCVMDVEDCGG